MGRIYQIFLQGLVIALPVSVTSYLLYWLVGGFEGLFSSIAKYILGKDLYLPGLGIIFTLIFVFCVGLLVNTYFLGRLIKKILDWLEKLPIIKSIYGPLRDIMGLFDNSQHANKRVVLVEEADNSYRIGLVTREKFDDLHKDLSIPGLVAVYFPLSYMFGGVTKLISKDQVKEIDIPVDQALKLALTGWVKTED